MTKKHCCPMCRGAQMIETGLNHGAYICPSCGWRDTEEGLAERATYIEFVGARADKAGFEHMEKMARRVLDRYMGAATHEPKPDRCKWHEPKLILIDGEPVTWQDPRWDVGNKIEEYRGWFRSLCDERRSKATSRILAGVREVPFCPIQNSPVEIIYERSATEDHYAAHWLCRGCESCETLTICHD